MTKILTSLDGTPASRLAFGTMQFGGRADASASQAMFDTCLDAGVTHFDTAYVYNGGSSEEILGTCLGAHRDKLVVATKADFEKGGTRDNIIASCDVSRQRMQLDVIDVFYMHRFDPDTDLRESMQALAELKSGGKIRYVGVSNFAAWQVMKAISIAAEFEIDIDIIQPMYNLVKRQAEVELLPLCIDQNVACAPYSPLGGGLLTGKYGADNAGRLAEDDMYAKRYGLEWMHSAAQNLKSVAQEENIHPATLAVAWAAAHPMGPTPIISGRSADQLTPSLAALHLDLSADLYARLSSLSPTPPPATDRIEEQ